MVATLSDTQKREIRKTVNATLALWGVPDTTPGRTWLKLSTPADRQIEELPDDVRELLARCQAAERKDSR